MAREESSLQMTARITEAEGRIDKLLELKLRDLLTDTEYLDERTKMNKQIVALRME